MNKLKKLFSPTALASTLATAMLLNSAVRAFADQISTCAFSAHYPCDCYGTVVFGTCSGDGYYWCCPPGYHGAGFVGSPCDASAVACSMTCGGNLYSGILALCSNTGGG